MHQYLFHIGDFPIRMYGLVLCMSIFLATGVAYFLAKQDGRWQQHILDIGDRKSTRQNSSHGVQSRMPSSA